VELTYDKDGETQMANIRNSLNKYWNGTGITKLQSQKWEDVRETGIIMYTDVSVKILHIQTINCPFPNFI
jgi:hypothetical protein